MNKQSWYLYIVKCADESLYTGITTDPKRRIHQHNSGLGSKYIVSSKRPVKLCYLKKYQNKPQAAKKEHAIKNWKRKYKNKFINKQNSTGFIL